ncbi:fasciclin domain-containing protein [Mucilaginibacter sp. JRF]|uniref:fasciclin domain-containing protein n=1 Tax=Mucilaginibacter sp. JRF TaxID=2780088 RepID=UPI00187FB20D|nr:fasciclin domain-containing protein [Mucilaginibacter sp. JRF]MBE9586451.1 fasciclin domain-containing protein [Mucilaginibacter sp. JRF]
MMKLIKAIAFIGILFTIGCKDSYFTDGGAKPADQSGNLGVSTMDYLESHRESFDTLARLIRLTKLEDEVNAQGNTFFAPRDYSIHNYFKLIYPDPQNTPATLEAIPQEDMDRIAAIIKNYIIPGDEIVRNDLATTYSYATTSGDTKARFNVVTSDYLGNVNLGAKFIMFSLNVSPAGATERYQSVQVVTADLRSTNGVVHILNSDTHIFGFN